MSDYAASVLAKGQTVVTAKYQSPEQRRKMPTVMELAIRNQKISIPNAQDLRVSPLRTVDVNFLTNVAAGSATAKVAVHTGTYGDSAAINVVYVTQVETMSMPRKLAYNNINSYQELFNNLFEMKWKNLRTRQDTSALAFLIANRVQLSNAVMDPQIASAGFGSTGTVGQWNQTNYAAEIANSNKTRFIQYAKALMASRYYTGPYDIISDLQMAAEFEFQLNQGQGNATNTSFQFGDAAIAATQDQVSTDYPLGAALVMPQGTLAGLVWNEGLNKAGVNAGQNSVGNLGTVADPFGSGAIADISMYTARADTSANTTGGSTQDIVDQWEIALTIGYVAPPLSVVGDSVIHLFGQAS